MKIDILGTKYDVKYVNQGTDDMIDNGLAGYCDHSMKKIVLLRLKTSPAYANVSDEGRANEEKSTLRHEILHAFFNESGLQANTCQFEQGWATNEEMVDWFAVQSPKIFTAFQKAGAI